jgi:DNA-binding response OmpR family regulator
VQGLRAAGFDAVGAEDAAAARRTCSRGAFPSSCSTRAWVTEALHSPKLRELTGACIVAPQQISERERRAALEQGADTCLVKPVGLDVLVLSVQDLLRRLQGAMPLATGLTDASGWRIGAHGWDLLLPNGITLQLTHGERLLPEALSASPGRTVSYETILARFSHAKLDSDMQRLAGWSAGSAAKPPTSPVNACPWSVVRGVGYVLHGDRLPHHAAAQHGAEA